MQSPSVVVISSYYIVIFLYFANLVGQGITSDILLRLLESDNAKSIIVSAIETIRTTIVPLLFH
jgi:hypothetical protein